MPAQAGIQTHLNSLGSRLRGNDESGIFRLYLIGNDTCSFDDLIPFERFRAHEPREFLRADADGFETETDKTLSDIRQLKYPRKFGVQLFHD